MLSSNLTAVVLCLVSSLTCRYILFFTTALSARQKGRGQHVAIKGEVEGMLRNQSCDWSTRFMKVILLGLSLVNTN